MEQQPNTSTYLAAKNGFVIGVALIAFDLLMWLLDMKGRSVMQNLNLGVMIFFIVFFTKNYRDQMLGGYISYSKALGFGVLMSFFASILAAFFTYILFQYLDPTLSERMIDFAEQQMIDSGESDTKIDQAIMITRQITTPFMLTISAVFSYTLFGFLIALVTSFFLKKDQNPFIDTTQPTELN